MEKARGSPLLRLLFLTAVLLAPFLDKPFHIDDVLFIRKAEQIARTPLDPYAGHINWTWTPVPMWLASLNPPLNAYFLAGARAVGGDGEIAAHAVYLVFPLGCVLLMWALARRFCRDPSFPVLATVLSPAFLVSSTNVMADVPLLLLWLLSVHLVVRAAEGPRWLLWPAAGAMTLAALCKYFGIAVVPLLAAYWIVKTDPRDAKAPDGTPSASGPRWSDAGAFLLPVLILLLWGAHTASRAGFFHPAAAGMFGAGTPRVVLPALGTGCVFLGGCLLWPVFAAPAWLALRLDRAALGLGVLALLWAAAPETYGALWPAMAAGGVLLVAVAADRGARDPEGMLLTLWLGGTFAFAALINWTVNARILLPAAFPAAVIFTRWMEDHEHVEALRHMARVGLVLTGLISFGLAGADWELAASSRGFARGTARDLISEGRRVRFIGHWGYQHYMEREGARAFDYRRPGLEPGDILCVSTNNTNTLPLPEKLRERMKSLAAVSTPGKVGLRTMDRNGHSAGFYSSMFGPVPFSFGRSDRDTFLIEEYQPEGVGPAPAH